MTRRPVVNYVLIAVNVALFLMGYHGATVESVRRIEPYLLQNIHPQVYQFFSSMFLHGDFWHLGGNMLFLWVFGNAINDKLGNVGYLAFYLAGGLAAGIGYLLVSPQAPVLGASGAISAVTGAYLVLLPRVNITVMLLFFFITFFQVSSLFFLAFQFLYNMFYSVDVLTNPGGGGGVAYTAHAAGYIFGILLAAGMLLGRLVPRDAYDLLNLFKSWQRRTRYRNMVNKGHDPFSFTSTSRSNKPGRKKIRARLRPEPPDMDDRERQIREEITTAIQQGNLPEAAEKYLQLVRISEKAILSRNQQLDIANQLMSDQRYPAAADAYERYLDSYGNSQDAGDIHLMLGLLYGRYLHQYDQAEEYLRKAEDSLHDQRKKKLADDILAEVRSARGKR